MRLDIAWTRSRSAALFGNEKFVEVVLALAAREAPETATAQDISRATGIAHPMVRDVLRRLTAGDVLIAIPKLGGTRSAQFYQVRDRATWVQLVGAAQSASVEVNSEPRAGR